METIQVINHSSLSFRLIKSVLSLLFILTSQVFFGQTIVKKSIYSAKMNKTVDVVVILPSLEEQVQYKTVYILHGYSGNAERTYQKDIPDLVEKAERYQTIYVLPDGNYNSWYVDSSIDSTSQYETFIGKELVEAIDADFPTIPNKENRGILGWSMGGFGALHISIAHPDIFSIVGSTCGAIDLTAFETEYHAYQIDKKLGNRKELPSQFKLFEQVNQMKNADQYYILDCGTEDTQMIEMNRSFHQHLTANDIIHSYTEYKGEHNTAYWSKALSIQLALFDDWFKNK